MAKFKYFELDEFVRSDTADKLKIANVPTFEVVDHLAELTSKILDPLRAAYGKPITISSGYRCEELNKKVGGSSTSVHKLGYAADMVVSGSFDEFCDFVKNWLSKTKTRFDQLILEQDGKGKRWLHISIYNNLKQQRGQIKTMNI